MAGMPDDSREKLAALRQALAAAGAPEQLLTILDGTDDPTVIMQRMTEAGLAPPPSTPAELIAEWEPFTEPGTDPLDVELGGAEFLSLMRQGADNPADLPDMLATLITEAEQDRRPAALALLRALAHLAPDPVRSQAAAAADRLVTDGLADPPWAADLGAPVVSTCFGYTDEVSQEVIAITFRYGRQRHAFSVLIDYELGGGVKDVWPTDRATHLRAQCRDGAAQLGLTLDSYQPAAARALLEAALAQPPCPADLEQVEDVDTYLELLRQRVALLPAPSEDTPVPERARRATGTPDSDLADRPSVHQVKVTLRGSKPPIWRRLEIPSAATLAELHVYLQEAFGWEYSHLWVFETPQGAYGIPDPELGHRSADSVRLHQVAPGKGDKIRYTYDFGDDWEHDVVVEAVALAEPGMAYPRCLTGRRAGPPEDCGGIWGYAELQEILANPADPEHLRKLDWLGLSSPDEFDPAEFDVDETNEMLPGRRVLIPT